MYRERKRRKIVLVSLIFVLMLMAVGYAAFQSQLQIKGTTKITSNWDVRITEIRRTNLTGSAEEVYDPSCSITGTPKACGEGLTASMEVDLYEKGDSVEYDVTISNNGTIDAKLDNISTNATNTDAVLITFSGYSKGERLFKSSSNNNTKTIHVKVAYNPNYDGEEKSGESSITFNYSQAEAGTIPPKNTYTLTYDYETNGGSKANETANYDEGENVDLTKQDNDREGYTLVGWNTDSSATTGLSSYTMPSNNVTLYAIYSKTVNVRYDVTGGINIDKKSDTCILYNNDITCDISSPIISVKDGYTFDGWYENNIKISNKTGVYSISSDKDYFIKAIPNTYIVNLYKNQDVVYSKNTLLMTINGRNYFKALDGYALAAYYYNTDTATTYPLVVSEDSDSSKIYTTYNYTNLGPSGNVTNGIKYYYTNSHSYSGNFTVEGGLFGLKKYSDTLTNSINKLLQDAKEAKETQTMTYDEQANLKAYPFSDSFSENYYRGSDVVYTKDTLLVTLNGRGYYKKYDGNAFAAYVYFSNGYTGLILVSEVNNAAVYYTSYDSGTSSTCSSFSYNGKTYYYSILYSMAGDWESTAGIDGIRKYSGLSYLQAAQQLVKDNTHTRINRVFAGWSETPTGTIKYTNEQSVKNLKTSGEYDLYALYAEPPTFEEVSSGSVMIHYPKGCGSSLTCTYKKDSENTVTVTSDTSVSFSTNGILLATISDGTNTASSSYSVIRDKLYVSSSGSDSTGIGTIEKPYATIQKAYNMASNNATIYLLGNITQTSTITMDENKQIALTSCTKRNETICRYTSNYSIIRGNSLLTHMIYNSAGTLKFDKITIDGNNVVGQAAMIELRSTATIESGCIIKNAKSSADYGGAIRLSKGSLTMNGGSITGNNTQSSSGGSALFQAGSTTFTMNNGSMTYNYSGSGGAIWSAGTIVIKGGTISNNNSSGTGGGIWTNGALTINGGTISNNTSSGNGGGIWTNGTLTINGGTISNNTSAVYGGGVSNSGGTVTLSGGTISGNSATFGGGIYAPNSASITNLNSGTISGNTATTGSGAGIYAYGTLNIKGGTISSNTAKTHGGGFMCKETCNITGGSITGNKAQNTGGGSRVDGTLTMSKGTISGNNASNDAGAVAISSAGTFKLSGGVIKKNTAKSNGGISKESNGTYTRTGGYVCKNNSPTNSYDITATSDSNCS